MPENERLRELQRRAYGPGGGLSSAEAEELAGLQAAVRAVAPAPVGTGSGLTRCGCGDCETRNGRDQS
ncbi:hypothetical protein [Microbacterium sp. NPDC057650]|uniref:hypothetical protein n=1 Tax=unclassified Microbacterium TaxID=2609290 RepID=UPI00366B3B98